MSVNEFLDLLCDAPEAERGSIRLQTDISSVTQWDSIGWLTVMALITEKLGASINSDDVRQFRTVGDLVRHLDEQIGFKKD